MSQAEPQELHFRQTIDAVRHVFDGPLAYAANWNTFAAVKWWNDLDVIGIDAYFQLSVFPHPSLDDLEQAWQPFIDFMARYANSWERQIIFTEVGFTSQEWSPQMPINWTACPLDLQIQATLYQALVDQVFGQAWFSGLFIWSWENDPSDGSSYDDGFTPKGKPAEEVLRQAFSKIPSEK